MTFILMNKNVKKLPEKKAGMPAGQRSKTAMNSAGHVYLVCKQAPVDASGDACESLIFCLECASIHSSEAYSLDRFEEKVEKSALYRSYLNLDGLNLLEQILYTQQKFSEYNDAFGVVDINLSLNCPSTVEILAKLVLNVYGACEEAIVIARMSEMSVVISKAARETLRISSLGPEERAFREVTLLGALAGDVLAGRIAQALTDSLPRARSPDAAAEFEVEVACLVRSTAFSDAGAADEALLAVAAVVQGCKREELRRRVLQCRAQLRVLHGGLETELLSAGRQEDEDDQVALSPAASADGEGEEREAAQLPAPVLFEGQGPETQSTRGTFLSTPEPPAEGGHVQGTTTQTLSEHRVTPTYQEEGGVSPPNNGKDDASSLHDAAPSSCSPPLLPEQQPAPASLATLSSDPVRSSSPDDHDAHRSPPAAQELQQQVDYQLRPMPEDEANAAGERDELDVGESGPHPTPDQDPASDLIPVPRSTVKAAAVPQRALSQSVVDALTSSVASSADFPRPANGPPDAQSLSEYAESAYTLIKDRVISSVFRFDDPSESFAASIAADAARSYSPSPSSPRRAVRAADLSGEAVDLCRDVPERTPPRSPGSAGTELAATSVETEQVPDERVAVGLRMRDKLTTFRTLLEHEDQCRKVRGNRLRVQVGKEVLAVLREESKRQAHGSRPDVPSASPLSSYTYHREAPVSGVSFLPASAPTATAGMGSQVRQGNSDLHLPAPPPPPTQRRPTNDGALGMDELGVPELPPPRGPSVAVPLLSPKPPRVDVAVAAAAAAAAVSSGVPGRSQSAGRGGRKLSNYPLIKNAVNAVCLAGAHFDQKRNEALDLLDYFRFGKQVSAETLATHAVDPYRAQVCRGEVFHFVVLFAQSKALSFKGIYAADPHQAGCYFRVYGKGPRDFTEDSLAVQQYLKFETSTKAFKQLHVKAISNNVDGVVIEVTGPSKLRT